MPDRTTAVRTIDRIVDAAPNIPGVRAHDVQPGDWIVVRTTRAREVRIIRGGSGQKPN